MARGASNVVTIDAPGDECLLPPDRRICFAATCPANLGSRLPPGVDHPTRCALDQGELLLDNRDRDKLIDRRKGGCVRLHDCEEAWILAHARTNINAQAKCPEVCVGFVPVGGHELIPLDALRKAAQRQRTVVDRS